MLFIYQKMFISLVDEKSSIYFWNVHKMISPDILIMVDYLHLLSSWWIRFWWWRRSFPVSLPWSDVHPTVKRRRRQDFKSIVRGPTHALYNRRLRLTNCIQHKTQDKEWEREEVTRHLIYERSSRSCYSRRAAPSHCVAKCVCATE